jgi:hypothetical protein
LNSIARIILFTLALSGAFLAGQHSSTTATAQTRHQWEYQIVRDFHETEKLNELGADGWDAVAMSDRGVVLLRRERFQEAGK